MEGRWKGEKDKLSRDGVRKEEEEEEERKRKNKEGNEGRLAGCGSW